jgi:3-oxoacyl-[acyl-carrier protein] reductase
MMLKGKTAVITGTHRGIGRSVLETYAQHGCNIFACARTLDPDFVTYLETLQQSNPGFVKAISLNLADEESVKAATRLIISQAKTIDILVNNAAIASGGLFQMTTLAEMRKVFEINFFSQMLFTQGIVRKMMKQKAGSIINISSTASLIADPGTMVYGSSKAAFSRATQSMATELGAFNIRVNAIAPGITRTDMFDQMAAAARDNLINRSALKRPAEPQDIANTALFLASDLSSFITGQIIRVDGGIV